MADETVVTELIIDARGAEVGSATYVKAMKAAQAAADRAIDSANDAAKAVESQSTVMASSAGSISSTAKAWERLKASVDPAYQATQRIERALVTADAAARKLGVDQTEINRVMDLARAKNLGTAVAVEEGAQAAKLGASQWAALGHSARSAAESLALGAPPMQVLTQQANHLSYAMSGPQGLVAASAGARAAFAAFLTTPVGALAVAGTAAVAAVAGYMLATREDIKSVDEILSGHKKLLDEIANTYPHLTSELKKYETEIAKLPHSVLAADAKTQIENDQRSLSASLDHLKVDLRELANTPDVVGTAGAAAFGKLADTIDAGNVDVAALVKTIGDLRLDPSLTPDAKHFAEGIQAAAVEAQTLYDTLNKDKGIKSVAIDGQKATKTLAEVSAGFKDTASKASSADTTISKLFGTISSGSGSGFGVSKAAGFGGLVGQFEQAGAAIQNMRRDQVQSMLELSQQFRDTTTKVDDLKQAIAGAAGKENIKDFFGDVSNIANANSELQNSVETVNKLFDALNSSNASANTVASGLDMIRQTLIKDGFGVDQVNKFVNSLIQARMQMDAGVADAAQLNRAIQAIKNRTVTITVVTRKVGTGTQSIYDVPNSSGGTSGVGVTRYGGDGAGPSVSSYSVPSSYSGAESAGSGSSYGGGGSSTVNVTRFATGGVIHPGDSQRVQFFKSPDETVGIFTPRQMQALADPQSAISAPSAGTDKLSLAITDTAQNTKKTAQILDDIKTSAASASSAFGGSSSGGSSLGADTSQQDQLSAQYAKVLKQIRSNFAAAGIVGRGIIGYGLDGLAASPEDIARNIVYGGAKSVGFATGGIMGGDSGDTQHVEFFKNANEKVIIARPDQFEDRRGSSGGGGITFSQTNNWKGSEPPSQDSLAAVRRATALGLMDAQRALNGR